MNYTLTPRQQKDVERILTHINHKRRVNRVEYGLNVPDMTVEEWIDLAIMLELDYIYAQQSPLRSYGKPTKPKRRPRRRK